MNVAVLFNIADDREIGSDTELAGKELYRYALKTFYFHPCIDCIVLVLHDSENAAYAEKYIENWKAASGVGKPVKIYSEIPVQRQVLPGGAEGNERVGVNLYVLHDVRYPFVSPEMIYRVVEKAALYGAAVTVGEVKDGLAACTGQEVSETEGLRYARYPAAVVAGYEMMKEPGGTEGILRKCAGYGSYLCGTHAWNPFISTWEAVEMAEAVLRMKREKYV